MLLWSVSSLICWNTWKSKALTSNTNFFDVYSSSHTVALQHDHILLVANMQRHVPLHFFSPINHLSRLLYPHLFAATHVVWHDHVWDEFLPAGGGHAEEHCSARVQTNHSGGKRARSSAPTNRIKILKDFTHPGIDCSCGLQWLDFSYFETFFIVIYDININFLPSGCP